MSSPVISTFANGTVLTSSAQTPEQIETVFQALIAQVLGFQINNPATPDNTQPFNAPLPAWYAVRVGWQQQGQPAWLITDDVCVIRARPLDHSYSRTREQIITQNDPVSVNLNMGFTQVWRVHFSVYGPNSYNNARLILSSMALDWTHDILAGSNLYAVVEWKRPVRNPELFGGRWWPRVDVSLDFNEAVSETYIVPAAASVDVTIESATASVEIEIETPS